MARRKQFLSRQEAETNRGKEPAAADDRRAVGVGHWAKWSTAPCGGVLETCLLDWMETATLNTSAARLTSVLHKGESSEYKISREERAEETAGGKQLGSGEWRTSSAELTPASIRGEEKPQSQRRSRADDMDQQQERDRRRTLLLVNLASIMERADEALLPAVYREVGAALHATPAGLGALTLCRSVVQAACYPLAAYAAARHNRAHVIAVGAFLWAAATFLVGVSDTFLQVRLNGIGLALVVPSIQSLVADSTDDGTRGTAFGWLQLASSLGLISGGFTTVLGIDGWRIAFHLVAAISIAVGILTWFFAVDPHFPTGDGGGGKQQQPAATAREVVAEMIEEAKFVVRIPTFQIFVAQGVSGTFPWSALSFASMWLELKGFSHGETAVLMTIFWVASSLGGLLGGKMGDYLAVRYPDAGRIVLSQISPLSAVPMGAVLLLGLPDDPSKGVSYAVVLFIMGVLMSWNGPATNLSFESVLSSFAPPIVGLLAQRVYGYKPDDKGESVQQDRENAASLAKALYTSIAIPFLICTAIYSFLYCSYPRDRERARMQSLIESELQQMEHESTCLEDGDGRHKVFASANDGERATIGVTYDHKDAPEATVVRPPQAFVRPSACALRVSPPSHVSHVAPAAELSPSITSSPSHDDDLQPLYTPPPPFFHSPRVAKSRAVAFGDGGEAEWGGAVGLQQQGTNAASRGFALLDLPRDRQNLPVRPSPSSRSCNWTPSPGELLALRLPQRRLLARPTPLSCTPATTPQAKVLTTYSDRPPALEENCPDSGNLELQLPNAKRYLISIAAGGCSASLTPNPMAAITSATPSRRRGESVEVSGRMGPAAGRQGRRTLVLVNLASIMERADEALLPAVYREVGAALHATPTGLGALTLYRSIVQAACYPVAAYAASRHNRAHVIALGAFLWAAATFLVAVSDTFLQSLVADSTDDDNRGAAFGWLQLTSSIGSIFGGFFALMLAQTTFLGIAGWRIAFHLVAIVSVIVGILVWLFAVDPHFPANNAGLHAEPVSKKSALDEARELLIEAKSIIQIPTFQVFVAQGVSGSFPWSALSFMSMWLELMGFSHEETAIFTTIFAVATSIGGLLGGKMGDFLAQRYPNAGRIILSQISAGSAVPLENAASLAKALYTAISIPMVICSSIYTFMYRTYPRDREPFAALERSFGLMLLGYSPAALAMADQQGRSRQRRSRRATLLLAFAALAMERADAALLPAVYREIGAALHASPSALGSIALSRSVVQTACYPLAAYLAARHDRLTVIALGAFIWAAATFLIGFSTTFPQVCRHGR
ncbi:hypothetical protein HU200_042212 [Digitaria exilis]|uniref:Major facilitator superfamily (MFS) profile domain-containing protein n=1 Tax=Digitaria exilis TaxID=1010633 RepID=A0A835B2W0_9POAL|nr:hypothetical protein HU200_042212 [Digitaria exilis]